jgi:phosphoacetylglucosamine mutase
MTSSIDKTLELLQNHPLLDEQTTYVYGTAGFRFKVEHMDGIMLRVGILSAFLLGKENMGVMVTASHNDESYNGVKISQPDGSMINSHQEQILVEWVNESSLIKWKTKLLSFQSLEISKAVFFVGHDTRSHSERLTNLLIQGAQTMGISVSNMGVVTTPMLHHIVLHSNPSYLAQNIQPRPSREGYVQTMAQAYLDLLQVVTHSTPSSTNQTLLVDCACGVGYKAVQEVCQLLESSSSSILPLNKPGDGPLNTNCGSEHVQKQLQPPTWYLSTPPDQSYCCSLDGDADRIVFFSSSGGKLTLLDGDKIAVLIGMFIQNELEKCYSANASLPKINVGVVQTAYANGASTNYLQVHTLIVFIHLYPYFSLSLTYYFVSLLLV